MILNFSLPECNKSRTIMIDDPLFQIILRQINWSYNEEFKFIERNLLWIKALEGLKAGRNLWFAKEWAVNLRQFWATWTKDNTKTKN